MREPQYRRIKNLVYRHSSIDLGENKKELVVCRLGKRIRKLGLKSFEEYLRYLESPGGKEEILNLVDAISTNHTFFFREIQHFEFLYKVAMPYWTETRGEKQLRLWSAACSTGEEPYSIAITCEEYRRSHPDAAYILECTDISRTVLMKAQAGIYSQERARNTPKYIVQRYFQRDRTRRGGDLQVNEALRRNLRFRRLNLLEFPYPHRQKYHVIFLRNVIMYFNKETQERLIGQLSRCLQPGGFLMIGHAENLNSLKHPLRQVQPAVFRLPENPTHDAYQTAV